MIKNLNDILSLVSMIIIVLLSLKYMLGTFVVIERKQIIQEKVSKFHLLKDYLDNDED